MSSIMHETVRSDRRLVRSSELVLQALLGGAALYVSGLLLELLEPGSGVFFAWVFGLPLVVGAVVGARGQRPARAAGPFVVAYLLDLAHDWIATGGDQIFHLVLAGLTGGLATLTATAARGVRRRRVRPTA